MNLRNYRTLHIPYTLDAIDKALIEVLDGIYTDEQQENYYTSDEGIHYFNALLSVRKLLKEI